MSENEVIELVENFRPSSIQAKLNWQSAHFVNITLFVQDYDMQWHRYQGNISKKLIKDMSGIDLGKIC